MIQDLSPSTITISPASIPPGNSQPESQTKNQPAKNQPGTEVLPEEKAREINQAITNLRTGARSAARIMAKLIGKDTGRAWIIENALKQPYSLETLQTAGVVLIQALAETEWKRGKREQRAEKVADLWRTEWNRNKSRPILPLAREILSAFERKHTRELMDELLETAGEISDHLPGNDLAGPTLQKLFHNRKKVASYHTIPECAALLAALAITPDRNWRTAKIADFAAGTGALPMAAYQRIRELHMRDAEDPKDAVQLHRQLVERGIFMADIMPASLAIATSNLANMEPESSTQKLQAMRMHHGVEQKKDGTRTLGLGSLDFIGKTPPKIPGRPPKSSNRKSWLDLVLANPPYTKFLNHGELDQNIPNAQAGVLPTTREELEQMDRMTDEVNRTTGAIGNTGIGYHFATMAQTFVKRGGIIALILPVTCLTSNVQRQKGLIGWQRFRKALAQNYRDVNVLSITHYNQRNSAISHDTKIAEVMITARRLQNHEKAPGTMNLINLKRKPKDTQDAWNIADAIRATIRSIEEPTTESSRESSREPSRENGHILMKDEDLGIITKTKIPGNEPWPLSQASQPNLVDAAMDLNRGIIRSNEDPHRAFSFPVRIMKELGQVNIHVDQNNKVFEQNEEPESSGEPDQAGNQIEERLLQSFMDGHRCDRDRTINAVPNSPRPVRKGQENNALIQQQKASRLHLSDSFRYNSQPLQAIYTEIPSLGGRGWPNVKMDRDSEERATAVWLNTTMGLVTQWALSNHIQKGFGSLSKKQLENMSTLNVRTLTEDQMHEMNRIFTETLDRPFLAANESWRDPMRIELDQKVITRVLNMGPEATLAVQHIRDQWCLEPTVQGNKGSVRNRSELMEILRRKVQDPRAFIPLQPRAPAISKTTTIPKTPAISKTQAPPPESQNRTGDKSKAEGPTRCNILNNPRPKIRFTANSIKSWKKARRQRTDENLPRKLIPIYRIDGTSPGKDKVKGTA